MSSVEFGLIDVFVAQPIRGNPRAVVADAGALLAAMGDAHDRVGPGVLVAFGVICLPEAGERLL